MAESGLSFTTFFLALCVILPPTQLNAQLTAENQAIDRNTSVNNTLQQTNQNQFNRNQNLNREFNRDRFAQDRTQQRFGDQSRNPQSSQNDITQNFYENTNRFGFNRFPSYSNPSTYGIYGQAEDIDPNHLCPEHWIAFRSSCLRFIKSPRHSWHDARKLCQAYKADLVNIDSIEKYNFIAKELIMDNYKNNRYFISARQTSPTSWSNEDNSNLFFTDESFVLDETDYERDSFDHWSNNNLLNNQDNINYNFNRNRQGYGTTPNPRSPNTFNIYDDRLLQRDRVVLAYSHKKDRWVYMPTFDFENNLYICESQFLYSADNIEKRVESLRTIDYGIDYSDPEKMPRGPYFIRQPNDTTYDTGKRKITNYVFIQCIAGGYPTPTYSWYKEEYINDNLTFTSIDPLKNSNYTISGGNLIIHNPEQTLHQGTYHCVAENKFGRIISESVQLNFAYILEFNLKRADEPGDMNWGKSLFCDPPTHYPGVKYYWARDYFPNFVEEDTRTFVSYDGALYFSALEAIDRGVYSCNVLQNIGSDTGRNGPFFRLNVKPHPNYQALLFANTFPKVFPEAPIAGEDIRLECMAFGYPVPSYNWTRKEGNIPRNSYTESYNRVLIIKNATVNDNGEYICTAKNDRKSLQKSVNVNIQMKPNFTIPLRDQVRDFNSEVTFVCEAFAIPDANYTWYKNAELMDRDQLDRDKYTIQDNVLTIKYLDPDKDDGMYQCKATNQLKGVFSQAQLRVLSIKPTFKKRPLESEIYAVQNGNTTIQCDPEAAPRPKFTWKKDGNVIGAGGHRRMLPSGTLIISPTSRDDEGVYTCVATNAYGSDESQGRLIVLQELRFLNPLQPKIVSEVGKFLYLQCDVYHDELLDVAFVWTHNGQIINTYSEEFGKYYEQTNPRIFLNYNSLEIHNLTLLDSGTYECIAKSAVNQISTRTELLVLGPPGMPGGVRVIEIKKKDAVIEWIDGSSNGRPIMYYNVLARTNWNKTWVNVTEGIIGTEIDRYTSRKRADINNLTPYCSYEFAVAAVNDLGIGPQSAPSPAHNTLHDKPYIFPRHLGGGGGKIGDLTLTWDPLLSEEQNSVGIFYRIFWRLHGKTGITEWASRNLTKHGNTGKATVHIPFDNYYTKYDVKVQAYNDQGAGPESDVAVIYSAEDMPQVAPQGVRAMRFNSTALNVTWNPVEVTREKIRGKLIGHRLKYWKKNLREEDSVYYLSRTTRNWALVVGLEADTVYYVKVMVYNAAGEGPESERYEERTYRKAPQKPPSSVHVIGINPSTVRVVWRYVSPSQEEEPVIGYKIRIWEADQDMSRANDTLTPVGRKLEAIIDTLTPGKMYRMRVLAYSNGGDGRMSSPEHIFQMGITQSPYRNAAVSYHLDKMLIISVLSMIYLLNKPYFRL